MSETTAFPRGRSRPPSSPEGSKDKKGDSKIAKKKRDAPSDVLFGQKQPQPSTSTRKKRKTTSTTEVAALSMLPLGGGGIIMPNQKQKEALIESLSFQKLAKGTKVLGVVREVNDSFALVSLPNLLTGYIIPKESDPFPLTAALAVGQFIACFVVKTATEVVGTGPSQQNRKRIQLSVEPHHLNDSILSKEAPCRGQITSVEDHGVVVSLGNGRQGFLKCTDIAGEYSFEGFEENNDDEDNKRFLHPGRVLDFMIKPEKTTTEVIPLTLPSHTKMAKSILPSTYHPTLTALNPGSLVHVKVESLARNGLLVSFLGGVFRGAIDGNHLGAHWRATTKQVPAAWKAIFEQVRILPARILAVDAKTKLVRLSLQSHVLRLRVPPTNTLPDVGTIIAGATVVRVDTGVGALLALPEDHDIVPPKLMDPLGKHEEYLEATRIQTAHVHISKAMDGRVTEAEFAKDFAPSTTHTLRIISNQHWMEGVATCATAPSIVEAHVLTHADLKVGTIYRAVPVSGQLDGGSIMVDFGMGVKGLIPSHHLFDKAGTTSDYRLKLRKEKFAIGNKIDVRVLELDSSHRKCTLTAKKSLLKCKECVTSYDDIHVGQEATGFVSKIDDRAVFVTFYNRVYGRVTARSLAAELGVENIRENYNMGDVVTCRVISCRRRVGKNLREYADDDEDMDDVVDTKRRGYWDLNLSLNLNVDASITAQQGTGERSLSGQVRIQAGAILPPKSMKVVEIVPSFDKKRGDEFVPGHAIVRIKAKYLLKSGDESSTLPYIDVKLPFDQLIDTYNKVDIETKEAMDELGKTHLTVGKKLNCKGLVLTDPKRSTDEYSSGIGKFPIVSLRPKLIETAENQAKIEADGKEDANTLLLPSSNTHLFMGAYVQGYVAQADPRHGSFVRFLDGLTGLVPKLKNGLELAKYETVNCQIVALDVTTHPMKILLKSAGSRTSAGAITTSKTATIKPGDIVGDAEITDVNFMRASVKLLDKKYASGKIRARLHVTMADAESMTPPFVMKQSKTKGDKLTKIHPFYKWKEGKKLSDLRCVAVDIRKGVTYVELTNQVKSGDADEDDVGFVDSVSELHPGMAVPFIVTAVPMGCRGIWGQVSPGINAFIPSLEISTDIDVLNDLPSYFSIGSKLQCHVMNKQAWQKRKQWGEKMPQLADDGHDNKKNSLENNDIPLLSLLLGEGEDVTTSKPLRGDLIVGRVNYSLRQQRAPALMLELRGGFTGRCCITELDECDDWVNMPLGRLQTGTPVGSSHSKSEAAEVDHVDMDVDEEDEEETETRTNSDYPRGKYFQCRVLAGIPSQPIVEVSLRQSRLEGDLDADQLPEAHDTVQAYVVETNRKGCFVRLSRGVQGRVILKELSDGFLPDPASSFPMGRLVVGKVKEVHVSDKKVKKHNKANATVDIDMRESILLDNDDKVNFEDIKVGSKHKAIVTRLEDYGVFVRLEKSDVSGLVHKSECSDKYIKNLADLFDPGDLVKVLVVKKDDATKKIGFSMKASHFEDDEDSDDDASIDDEEMEDAGEAEDNDQEDEESADDLDSEDENFMTKLAAKTHDEDDNESSSEDTGDEDSEVSDDETPVTVSNKNREAKTAMDTDVGFDWGTGQAKEGDDESSDDDVDSDDEELDDEDVVAGKGHSSRKKAALRRKDEDDIARRETALADGTADENPETPADFERLLIRNPNDSEHWMRFMAFHLSLADLDSARRVAHRAFDRIDARLEREKLNVWTALLTMELKFGSEDKFQQTIDKACQNNNPKQVYLRVCEMLEKEKAVSGASVETTKRADDMFTKMCKKFRGKKTVWIAHLNYLLHGGRHQEAQALLKRALTSLPDYKHVETMSKFAQLEFEFGSVERGRTIFDGLLAKYQKRMDLLFVYVDKEVKAGEFAAARALLDRTWSNNTKLSDKQMKSLFKKWYRIEELHGNEETQEHVKDAARLYVERSSK